MVGFFVRCEVDINTKLVIKKTIQSIAEPEIWLVILISAVINFAVLGSIVMFLWLFLTIYDFVSLPYLESFFDFAGLFFAIFIAFVIFPMLLPIMACLFYEVLAKKIYKRHYSHMVSPKDPAFIEVMLQQLKLSMWFLLLNLLCLPIYLIPVVNILVYYGLNGRLVGVSFFNMLAMLFMEKSQLEELRKKHIFTIYLIGVTIVLAANLPIVNIIVPLVAIIFMVHLLHQVR